MSIACTELLVALRSVYRDSNGTGLMKLYVYQYTSCLSPTKSVMPINMHIHLYIRSCGFLLILRSALYSNAYGANFRVWEHWLVSSIEIKNEWICSSDPPYSFFLFSSTSVPLSHLPNTHILRLVLFS